MIFYSSTMTRGTYKKDFRLQYVMIIHGITNTAYGRHRISRPMWIKASTPRNHQKF